MPYNVYQHWDPLKVCIVGKSYSPEFYSFIKNSRVRKVMERIAEETEEDYQKLSKLLETFNVQVLRPEVLDQHEFYISHDSGKIMTPPMVPRDYTLMFGEKFFFKTQSPLHNLAQSWGALRGDEWPVSPPQTIDEYHQLPKFVKDELKHIVEFSPNSEEFGFSKDDISEIDSVTWGGVLDHISSHGTELVNIAPICFRGFNGASTTRVGKDIYIGTEYYTQDRKQDVKLASQYYPDLRWHIIDTGGHSDSTFCPVKPGLIVSLYDVPTYRETFPDWEVVYLPNQSWDRVDDFLKLKRKNKGKWWVPGEELNDEFTDFVESWLEHWVGYVEETVFDINMLVIDEKNVICNNYNQEVFGAFERHGVTPHIVNFRHRYFWDGGLHCITSDVHREGTRQNYFPDRGD